MNAEERKKLAYEIEGVSQYYGRKVERQVLAMMVDDLEDLSFDDVFNAFRNYRRNPKNKFFPLPAAIREMIAPEITPEAQGRDIAASIQKAIVDHGYPNGARAKEDLGHDGWRVIEMLGGWAHLCQNLGIAIDVSSFYAQARQLAEDVVRYGSHRRHPQLEAPRTNLFIEAEDQTKHQDVLLNEKRDIQIRSFEDFLKQQEKKDSAILEIVK